MNALFARSNQFAYPVRLEDRFQKRCSRCCRGLTLVESLVVIAIIAVLGVILVPVVNSVIRKSGHTVCQSNLRQMAMATLIYVSEHNGQLPSRTFINTSNNYGIRSYLDLNEKSSDVGGG